MFNGKKRSGELDFELRESFLLDPYKFPLFSEMQVNTEERIVFYETYISKSAQYYLLLTKPKGITFPSYIFCCKQCFTSYGLGAILNYQIMSKVYSPK